MMMVRMDCPCLWTISPRLTLEWSMLQSLRFFYLHFFVSVYPSLEVSVADQLVLCWWFILQRNSVTHTLLIFSVIVILSKLHALFPWVLQWNNKLNNSLEQTYLYSCFVKNTSKYQKGFEILTFAFIKAKTGISRSLNKKDSDLPGHWNKRMQTQNFHLPTSLCCASPSLRCSSLVISFC